MERRFSQKMLTWRSGAAGPTFENLEFLNKTFSEGPRREDGRARAAQSFSSLNVSRKACAG